MNENCRPRVGFLLEQTLGHKSHAANLYRILPTIETIDPVFRSVHYELSDPFVHLPGYSNWTVRAGVRTGRMLREMSQPRPVDALFFHTQVIATLAGRWMKRIPSVVSLDATPTQYDEMGLLYGHRVASPGVEAVKHVVNRRCFRLAATLVTWSDWCRDSLVEHYQVPSKKIIVIPPGVDLRQWARPAEHPRDNVVRILFVGGDLRRKGGHLLIEAFRRISTLARSSTDAPTIELHLVTDADVPSEPGLHVHHKVSPNSPELIDLYHRASIFCLPTLGDCLPMVLSEAGAAGLPMVSTRIGAIGEIVEDEDNGLLVEPGDLDALVVALGRLVASPELRLRMGRRAERVVAQRFDADVNVARLVGVLGDLAAGPRG